MPEAKDGPSVAAPLSPSDAKSSESSKNLVGKLLNLVSTDLQNIVDARDFVRLFALVPIQVVLCTVFLYVILGYRCVYIVYASQ